VDYEDLGAMGFARDAWW